MTVKLGFNAERQSKWVLTPKKSPRATILVRYFKEYFAKLHEEHGVDEHDAEEHGVDEHGADARDDVVMGLYAQNLIDDNRIADAREAMKGYEDTTNETLDDAFCRLTDFDEKPEFSAPLTKEQFWQTLTYVIRHNPADGPELIMQHKHLPLVVTFDKNDLSTPAITDTEDVTECPVNLKMAVCFTSLTPHTYNGQINHDLATLKEVIIEDLFATLKRVGANGVFINCTTFNNDQIVGY